MGKSAPGYALRGFPHAILNRLLTLQGKNGAAHNSHCATLHTSRHHDGRLKSLGKIQRASLGTFKRAPTDLFAQYRGENNGDLCAAWKFMQPRGWRSELTLQRAKQELLKLGLIVETRKGARPNKASLYAVTWCALDHCNGKLDISPAVFSRGAYRLRDSVPILTVKNEGLTTPHEVAESG